MGLGNEVGVTVTGDNRGGPAFAAAQRQMKDVGSEAKKVTAEMALLDAEIQKTERDIDRMGRAWARGFRSDQTSSSFSAELKKARGELAELKRAKKDIFGGEGGDSDSPGRTRSWFGIMVEGAGKAGADGASTFASAFQGGLMNAFKGLPPEAQAGIAAGLGGAVAVAGPFIASTISLAVLGGVGAGGIVGGILLAAQDQRVKDAWGKVAETGLQGLQKAASPFIAPLVDAGHEFADALGGPTILPVLQQGFSALATTIKPLVEGATRLAEKALPGIVHAMEAAAPLFRALADEGDEFGAAVGSFFDSMADGGPGAIAALKTILHLVEGGLVLFGEWVEWGSKVYAGLYLISGMQFFDNMAEGGRAFGQVLEQTSGLAQDTTVQVQGLGVAMDELFDRFMDSDTATLRLHQEWTKLNEELREGTHTLNLNTKAGQENVAEVLRFLDVARAKYDADVREHGASQQATDNYNAQVTALRKLLVQQGYNREDIDKLVDKYFEVPGNVNTDITLNGAAEAASALSQLASVASQVPRVIGMTVVSQGIGRRASGGVSGGWTVLNEHRSEVVRLPSGAMVYPTAAQGMAADPSVRAGAGMMGGELRVVLDFSGAVDTYAARSLQAMFNANLVTVQAKHVVG